MWQQRDGSTPFQVGSSASDKKAVEVGRPGSLQVCPFTQSQGSSLKARRPGLSLGMVRWAGLALEGLLWPLGDALMCRVVRSAARRSNASERAEAGFTAAEHERMAGFSILEFLHQA